MWRFLLLIIVFSLMALEDIVSADQLTGLKFDDDPNSVITFNPDMTPLAEKFSFCVWINKLRSGNLPVAFSYAQLEIHIWDFGNYRLFFRERFTSARIPDRQWTQYCGTWSLASQRFRVYFNDTLVSTTYTQSGRTLRTDGEVVLGNYLKGHTDTLHYFGGEMYNFNWFSKELTASEVAAMSANGVCTQIPEELEEYRLIKWEDTIKEERSGTVKDINMETLYCKEASAKVTRDVKNTGLKLSQLWYHFITFYPDMPTGDYSFCLWINGQRSETYGPSRPLIFGYKDLYISDFGQTAMVRYNLRQTVPQIPKKQWSLFCYTYNTGTRTARSYINGTLADTYITDSVKRLPTGGEMILGNVGKTNGMNYFGGEMYNFNWWSKELTYSEVAIILAGGCTPLPAYLEEDRAIKWEDIMMLERTGTVTDIDMTNLDCKAPKCNECDHGSLELESRLQEFEKKLLAQAGELYATKTELENTKNELQGRKLICKRTSTEELMSNVTP